MTLERWRPSKGVTPWSPFRELEGMERSIADIFGRQFLPAALRAFPFGQAVWSPAIDVFEKGDKFVVKVELPGMKEDDIDVSVVGDTLTIKGEKKTETEVNEGDYHHSERSYGSFMRSIALPSTVDASKIAAEYEEGVLEINLPKKPEVKPKKVTVSVKKAAKAKKEEKKTDK